MPSSTSSTALLAATCASLAALGCGAESPDPGSPRLAIFPSSLTVAAGSGLATVFTVADMGPARPAVLLDTGARAPRPIGAGGITVSMTCQSPAWMLEGPGSLQVSRLCDAIYTPPPAGAGAGTAVLSASLPPGSSGVALSGSVMITILQP